MCERGDDRATTTVVSDEGKREERLEGEGKGRRVSSSSTINDSIHYYQSNLLLSWGIPPSFFQSGRTKGRRRGKEGEEDKEEGEGVFPFLRGLKSNCGTLLSDGRGLNGDRRWLEGRKQ